MGVYKSNLLIGIISSVVFLSSILSSYAFIFDPGETGGAFLKLGIGAAPIGMGEAYTALADDVDSVYWNPAGLTDVQNIEVSFMHLEWLRSIRYESLGYAQSLGNYGAVGGHVSFLYTDEIDKVSGAPGSGRDWKMNDDKYFVPSGSEKFSADDIGLTLAYAYPLEVSDNKIALGGSVKVIRERVDEYSAFGGGVDIGGNYKIGEAGWYKSIADGIVKSLIPQRVGLVFQNFGLVGAMEEEGSPLPIAAKLGAGYQFNFLDADKLLVGVDLHQPFDNMTRLNVGGEYSYTIERVAGGAGGVDLEDLSLAGRLGYKLGGNIQRDLDWFSGLGLGGGVGITANSVRYELDYGFSPYGELGFSHRVSLTVKLGEERRKKGTN